MNVLETNHGTGPLKLLYDMSLEHQRNFIKMQISFEKWKNHKYFSSKGIYRNARCVILAKDGGIAPERLLLLSLLIPIQKPPHNQIETKNKTLPNFT